MQTDLTSYELELENDPLWARWEYLFPRNFIRVSKEHKVFGSLVHEGPESRGWRIDYIASFRGKRYVIEAILNEASEKGAPWIGFKSFGYRAAYAIDRHINPMKIGCMVFMPAKAMTHRIRNILAVSGLEYVTFNNNGGRWIPGEASLWRKR